MKPGQTAKGHILNSDTSDNADWYKINVNSHVSSIFVEYKSDGAVKCELYNSNGKAVSQTLSQGYNRYTITRDYGFEKGIYYLKIYKADKNSSMVYSVIVDK